jgi:chorismate mutase
MKKETKCNHHSLLNTLSIAKTSYKESIAASMPSTSDLRRQVDAIDRQLVELLSRRTVLVKQIMSQIDEEEPDKEREAQVLSNWLEEGFDYDLDEASVEKVCKTVMEMGRKAREI